MHLMATITHWLDLLDRSCGNAYPWETFSSHCSSFIRCLWGGLQKRRFTWLWLARRSSWRERLGLFHNIWEDWESFAETEDTRLCARYLWCPVCFCMTHSFAIRPQYHGVRCESRWMFAQPEATGLGVTIKGSHNVQLISATCLISFFVCVCLEGVVLSTWFGFHKFPKLPLRLLGGQKTQRWISRFWVDTNELWWKFTSHHCRAWVSPFGLMLQLACCSHIIFSAMTRHSLDEAMLMKPWKSI